MSWTLKVSSENVPYVQDLEHPRQLEPQKTQKAWVKGGLRGAYPGKSAKNSKKDALLGAQHNISESTKGEAFLNGEIGKDQKGPTNKHGLVHGRKFIFETRPLRAWE